MNASAYFVTFQIDFAQSETETAKRLPYITIILFYKKHAGPQAGY